MSNSHSYYLYSISHPNSCGSPLVDLSRDNEAAVSLSLPENQLPIERVITKVFHHYEIPLYITDAIRAAFKSKLWRMGKCLATLGGPKRAQRIEDWKNSMWTFSVSSSEVCRQLHKRKCDVEELLSHEITKRQKIEEDVETLKEEVITLKELQRDGRDPSKRPRPKRRAQSKDWKS